MHIVSDMHNGVTRILSQLGMKT